MNNEKQYKMSDVFDLPVYCGKDPYGVPETIPQRGEKAEAILQAINSHDSLVDQVQQQQARIERQEEMLHQFKVAINRIDDWFEYANESLKDREKVHVILAELTEGLTSSASQSNAPKSDKEDV